MAEEAATQRFLSVLSTGSTPLAVAKTVLTDKDTLHTAEKFLNENIAQNGQRLESAKVGGGYLHRLLLEYSGYVATLRLVNHHSPQGDDSSNIRSINPSLCRWCCGLAFITYRHNLVKLLATS